MIRKNNIFTLGRFTTLGAMDIPREIYEERTRTGDYWMRRWMQIKGTSVKLNTSQDYYDNFRYPGLAVTIANLFIGNKKITLQGKDIADDWFYVRGKQVHIPAEWYYMTIDPDRRTDVLPSHADHTDPRFVMWFHEAYRASKSAIGIGATDQQIWQNIINQKNDCYYGVNEFKQCSWPRQPVMWKFQTNPSMGDAGIISGKLFNTEYQIQNKEKGIIADSHMITNGFLGDSDIGTDRRYFYLVIHRDNPNIPGIPVPLTLGSNWWEKYLPGKSPYKGTKQPVVVAPPPAPAPIVIPTPPPAPAPIVIPPPPPPVIVLAPPPPSPAPPPVVIPTAPAPPPVPPQMMIPHVPHERPIVNVNPQITVQPANIPTINIPPVSIPPTVVNVSPAEIVWPEKLILTQKRKIQPGEDLLKEEPLLKESVSKDPNLEPWNTPGDLPTIMGTMGYLIATSAAKKFANFMYENNEFAVDTSWFAAFWNGAMYQILDPWDQKLKADEWCMINKQITKINPAILVTLLCKQLPYFHSIKKIADQKPNVINDYRNLGSRFTMVLGTICENMSPSARLTFDNCVIAIADKATQNASEQPITDEAKLSIPDQKVIPTTPKPPGEVHHKDHKHVAGRVEVGQPTNKNFRNIGIAAVITSSVIGTIAAFGK